MNGIQIVLMLSVLAFTACQTEPAKEPAHASPPPDPAELLQRWNNIWNSNDLEGLQALVAENVVLSLQGEILPPDALYQWMSESGAQMNNLTTDAVHSNTSEGISYQTSTFSHGPLKNSDAHHYYGTFTFIWERQQNGEWKIKIIDITGYRTAEAE